MSNICTGQGGIRNIYLVGGTKCTLTIGNHIRPDVLVNIPLKVVPSS
jgi:hypothetical protein